MNERKEYFAQELKDQAEKSRIVWDRQLYIKTVEEIAEKAWQKRKPLAYLDYV